MKRAQIEAARIRAKELKEEEKQKIRMGNGNLDEINNTEPLGETARTNIVTQEKLVIIRN